MRAPGRARGLWALLSVVLCALLSPTLAAAVELLRGETARYRFEWAPGLDGYAESLMARVEGHHDRIYGELGIDSDKPTTVVVLRDQDEMLEEARRRFGTPPPEWAAGLAWPAHRTILLHVGVGPAELDATFRHEISHVAFGEIGAGRNVPRWFTEGLAIKQSEGIDFDRAWMLTEAATMGALHPLRALDRGFPASGARAGVAYAQAVHFVGYLQSVYGEERFQNLIKGLRDGVAFDDAVRAAFGTPLPAIEAEWQKTLEVRWGWLPVLFGSTSLWALATVMLVLAWRRRKRQRAAQMAILAAREAVAIADDVAVAAPYRPPAPPPEPRPGPPPEPPPPPRVVVHDPYDGRPPTIH
ncbi:MAG: peptidase MA family metallohydrolase [bacterium]